MADGNPRDPLLPADDPARPRRPRDRSPARKAGPSGEPRRLGARRPRPVAGGAPARAPEASRLAGGDRPIRARGGRAPAQGPRSDRVVLSAGMLVALVWWRDDFIARTDPRSLLTLALFVPAYLAARARLRHRLAADRARQAEPGPDRRRGARDHLRRPGRPRRALHLREQASSATSSAPHCSPSASSVLAIALVPAVPSAGRRERPSRRRPRARPRAGARATAGDTLAYFALRDDKSYFFSSDGEAMIAYAYMGGYALVSADPIGRRPDRSRWSWTSSSPHLPRAGLEGRVPCGARGRRCRSTGQRGLHRRLPRRRGDHSLRPLHARRRSDEAGPRGGREIGEGQSVPADSRVRRLARVSSSSSTRSATSGAGRGASAASRWSSATTSRATNPDFLLAIAAAKSDDAPAGFLRLVPCYGDDPGYSLDLMRASADAPSTG